MSERDLSGIWSTGEHKRNISGAFALDAESAHGHRLVGFVFKRATHSICCSSAGGFQTALHYCGCPFWIGGELPVFDLRPHAPNREVRTVTVLNKYMYRATPNI